MLGEQGNIRERGETHYYDVSSPLLLDMLVHLLPFVILRINLGSLVRLVLYVLRLLGILFRGR